MATEKDTAKAKKTTKKATSTKTAKKAEDKTETSKERVAPKTDNAGCGSADCCQKNECCPGSILKNFVCKTITICKDPSGAALTKIADEDNDNQSLFTKYIFPGLLIAGIASFLSSVILGNESYPEGFFATLYTILIEVIFGAGVFIVAGLVLSKVSEKFLGKSDFNTALKVLTFSFIPYLLASVFKFFPALWVLTCLVGAYCLYLFYLAFAQVLKISSEKQPIAYVTNLIALVIVGFILNAIVNFVTPSTIEDHREALKAAGAEAGEVISEITGSITTSTKSLSKSERDKEIDAAIELLKRLKEVD